MADCKAAIILGEKSICENCLKSDVCKHKASIDKDPILEDVIERCEYFKDRSKFIELPCKVGDVIYIASKRNNKVFSRKVLEILLKENNGYIYTEPCYFIFDDFGKIAFLTKEEAEKALAERGEQNG